MSENVSTNMCDQRRFKTAFVFTQIPQRIIVHRPNRKRHDSVHPNIISEHEIRDSSSEILTGKKATRITDDKTVFDIEGRNECFLVFSSILLKNADSGTFLCRPYCVLLNQ